MPANGMRERSDRDRYSVSDEWQKSGTIEDHQTTPIATLEHICPETLRVLSNNLPLFKLRVTP